MRVVNFKLVSLLSLGLCQTIDAQAIPIPISASFVSGLNFGKFAAGSGGSVTISPSGVRTKTGSVSLLSSGPGNAARVQITGAPNASFVLTLPNDNQADVHGENSSIGLCAFTASPSTVGHLDSSGNQIVNIGATLKLDATKPASQYNGTFPVMVNYQ